MDNRKHTLPHLQEKLHDEAATAALAARLARSLHAPATVWLQGNLGAGKTTFVRAFLRARGYLNAVKSPTYTLVESYRIDTEDCHHFDLYRFADPEEWSDAGFDELFCPSSICFIEWPQNGGCLTPPPDLTIRLETDGTGRHCTLTAHTAAGTGYLNNLPPVQN